MGNSAARGRQQVDEKAPIRLESGSFKETPDDVFHHMCKFLDNKTVARLATVSHHFNFASSAASVWRPRLARAFPEAVKGPDAPVPEGQKETKLFGIPISAGGADPKRRMRDLRQSMRRQVDEQYRLELQQHRRRKCSWFMLTFSSPYCPPITVFLLMLFAVTAHNSLANDNSMSLTAFAPILLLMAFLSTVVVCVCSAALNGPLPFDEGAFARATGPIVFWVRNALRGNRWQHAVSCGVWSALVAFVALFALRFAAVIDISWHLVFLPMWVLVASFLLCSCQPVPRQFFRTWSVRVRWTARFFAFALGPLSTLGLLLHLKLSGVATIPVIVVVIPIFALNVTLLSSVIIGARVGGGRVNTNTIMTFCCFVEPFIIFTLLVALKLDGTADMSWRSVFVPLWIVFAMCFPVSLGGCNAMHRPEIHGCGLLCAPKPQRPPPNARPAPPAAAVPAAGAAAGAAAGGAGVVVVVVPPGGGDAAPPAAGAGAGTGAGAHAELDDVGPSFHDDDDAGKQAPIERKRVLRDDALSLEAAMGRDDQNSGTGTRAGSASAAAAGPGVGAGAGAGFAAAGGAAGVVHVSAEMKG